MSFRIGLCDSNKGYAESLAEYADSYEKRNIKVIIFSDMTGIEDFLQRERLDLVLTDDIGKCEYFDGVPRFCGVAVKQLVEKRDTDNPYEIYRYQAGCFICEGLLKGVKAEKKRNAGQKVCVYSPLGRSGKTGFATAYALYNSPDCIYIGMEDFSGYKVCDTDILYLIKGRSPTLPKVISQQLMVNKGLTMLIPSFSYQDLLNVEKKDIELLNDTLSGMGKSFIYDFGSGVLGDMSILTAFDTIYMPVLGDEVSGEKLNNFDELVRKRGLSEIFGKVQRIVVPGTRGEINKMIEELC